MKGKPEKSMRASQLLRVCFQVRGFVEAIPTVLEKPDSSTGYSANGLSTALMRQSNTYRQEKTGCRGEDARFVRAVSRAEQGRWVNWESVEKKKLC